MKNPIGLASMKRFFILSICVLFYVEGSFCNTIYVASGASGSGTKINPAGLQTGLDLSRTNGISDTLLLQSGTYNASVNTFIYDTTNNDNHAVLLSGGWNNLYDTQLIDFSATQLDGGGINQVLYIAANKQGLDYHFSLYNLTIQNGKTTNRLGAGLWAYIGSTANNDVGNLKLYVNGCNFNHNNATTNMSGGAIYANCYFEITSSKFYSNSAYNGGALVSTVMPDLDYSMSPLIDNCYFEDNTNYGNQGSTIWHNVTLRFINSTIKGRTDGVSSSGNGSSIWGNSGSYTIAHNSLFTKISIQYWGGSIQAFDGGMELVNCVFEDNQVIYNGFAAVTYFHNNSAVDRKITITNCTFVGNHSYLDEAGAIHVRLNGNDSCIVTNCIFMDNGSYPIEKEYSSSYAGVSNSLIQGGFAGYGFTDEGNNLGEVDPLFESAINYHLTFGSPCINAGNNNASAILPYDMEGTIRNLGNNVDMGAYEFNQAPTGISLSSYMMDENMSEGTLVGLLSVNDPDAGDLHSIELSPGDGINDADNLHFSITGNSLFVMISPNHELKPEFHIFLKAFDSGEKDTSAAIIIEVNDLNEAPIVSLPINDQQVIEGMLFSFSFPENSFADEDAGDILTYSTELNEGGSLPSWLIFNDVTRTFSGIPEVAGTLEIKVIAKDLQLFSVDDLFDLNINPEVGISEIRSSAFSIYPNPSSIGFINIKSVNIARPFLPAFIYSLEGRLLMQFHNLNPTQELDINALPSGTYLLALKIDSKLSYSKFSVIK